MGKGGRKRKRGRQREKDRAREKERENENEYRKIKLILRIGLNYCPITSLQHTATHCSTLQHTAND